MTCTGHLLVRNMRRGRAFSIHCGEKKWIQNLAWKSIRNDHLQAYYGDVGQWKDGLFGR